MFRLFVFVCLCYFTFAAIIPSDKNAAIVSYDYQHLGRGNYQFSYVTSNGIVRNETGRLVNEGEHNAHLVVTGYFTYIDPDGVTRFLQYTADENGYHVNFITPDLRPPEDLDDGVLINRVQSTPPHLVLSLLGG